MNLIRRGVIRAAMGVSMNERCAGASTNGPAGKLARPSTRSRKNALARAKASAHATR